MSSQQPMSSAMSSGTAEDFEFVGSEVLGERFSEGKSERWSCWAESKESHIEMRTMKAFLEPHELVRQVMTTFADWEIEGDPSWLNRTLREWVLRLIRSLRRTYDQLEWDRAAELGKFCVWEGVRRSYWANEDQGAMVRKVSFGLELVLRQENECQMSDSDAIVRPIMPFMKEPLTKGPFLENLRSCKETSFELSTIYMVGARKLLPKLKAMRKAFLEVEAKLLH